MLAKSVKSFLDKQKVNYTVIPHPVTYAARDTSHACNVPEFSFAKSVIVRAGNKMVMLVIPASEKVNFNSLKKSLKEEDISLASEKDFAKQFPDCEVGAEAPFGCEMQVCVEKHLANNREIVCNGGTHSEAVKLAYQDFKKMVHPKEISITH